MNKCIAGFLRKEQGGSLMPMWKAPTFLLLVLQWYRKLFAYISSQNLTEWNLHDGRIHSRCSTKISWINQLGFRRLWFWHYLQQSLAQLWTSVSLSVGLAGVVAGGLVNQLSIFSFFPSLTVYVCMCVCAHACIHLSLPLSHQFM